MVVMAATNCSVAAERVQGALARRRGALEADRQRQGAHPGRGIDQGELPADTDALALANFYAIVYQGMSMQAKDGATHKSLLARGARWRCARGPADREPASRSPT